MGEVDNPERVICIENKINSKEGIRQTKRYYETLEHYFKKCETRDYIYLTKNNSSIILSADCFTHIRYRDVAEILMQDQFNSMRCAKDFCEYYVFREERLFAEIEKCDRISSSASRSS